MNILPKISKTIKNFKHKDESNDYDIEQRLAEKRFIKRGRAIMNDIERDMSHLFKKGD
jgi:hypothetical protein